MAASLLKPTSCSTLLQAQPSSPGAQASCSGESCAWTRCAHTSFPERALLCSQAGIKSKQERQRGYDHGVFVLLGLVWPDADVPLAVLSINTSHDPEASVAGFALLLQMLNG